jgi:hypothetical protein
MEVAFKVSKSIKDSFLAAACRIKDNTPSVSISDKLSLPFLLKNSASL